MKNSNALNIKLNDFIDTLIDCYELSVLMNLENLYLMYDKRNGSCYITMDDMIIDSHDALIIGFINGTPF
jgi:hypothetical protein